LADLKLEALRTTSFAFRGYNVTNLGRTPELLAHKRFGDYFQRRLIETGTIASDVLKRKVDLVARVESQQETDLATYADAVAMIMGVEIAQIDVLRNEFQVDLTKAQYLLGYSLGELAALVVGGSLTLEDALKVPLSLSTDIAELAPTCTLAVLFCRKAFLPAALVHRACQEIACERNGLIGISSILSPNSVIVIGEGDTTSRLQACLNEQISDRVYVKKNPHRWPPMHTPIVWRHHITSRAALLMSEMQSGFTAPNPPILSLVTGACSYDANNIRDLIYQWVDRPQDLWRTVYHMLSNRTQQVIHVGPQPNIIPATLTRIAENVETQLQRSFSSRTMSALVHRPWLRGMIPEKAYLLRAPSIKQVMLEDWLLAQE